MIVEVLKCPRCSMRYSTGAHGELVAVYAKHMALPYPEKLRRCSDCKDDPTERVDLPLDFVLPIGQPRKSVILINIKDAPEVEDDGYITMHPQFPYAAPKVTRVTLDRVRKLDPWDEPTPVMRPAYGHDNPPPGYAPCTRTAPHDGPCALPLLDEPKRETAEKPELPCYFCEKGVPTKRRTDSNVPICQPCDTLLFLTNFLSGT